MDIIGILILVVAVCFFGIAIFGVVMKSLTKQPARHTTSLRKSAPRSKQKSWWAGNGSGGGGGGGCGGSSSCGSSSCGGSSCGGGGGGGGGGGCGGGS